MRLPTKRQIGQLWDEMQLRMLSDAALERVRVLPQPHRRSKHYRPPEVWASLDWSKKNTELAAEVGVPASLMTGHRRAFAPHTLRPRTKKRELAAIDWTATDWAKGDVELARELGVSRITVGRNRPRAFKNRRHRRSPEFWHNVDWSRSDRELAAEHESSLGNVAAWRRKVNHPDYTPKPRPRHDWNAVDWRKSNRELGRELGVGYNLVSLNRVRYAPETCKFRKRAA